MTTTQNSLKIDWYRTPIERARLFSLTKRSDFKGAVQTISKLCCRFPKPWRPRLPEVYFIQAGLESVLR